MKNRLFALFSASLLSAPVLVSLGAVEASAAVACGQRYTHASRELAVDFTVSCPAGKGRLISGWVDDRLSDDRAASIYTPRLRGHGGNIVYTKDSSANNGRVDFRDVKLDAYRVCAAAINYSGGSSGQCW